MTNSTSSAPPPGSACVSGRRRSYSAEEKAQAIAYANLRGRTAASRKFGVSLRTVQRWVSRSDPKTTARAIELTQVAGDKWADEVLGIAAAVVIAGGQRKLAELENGAELTPKELHAWAGAMKLANDARTTAELLEQRKRPPRPAPPQKPAAPNVVALDSKERAA